MTDLKSYITERSPDAIDNLSLIFLGMIVGVAATLIFSLFLMGTSEDPEHIWAVEATLSIEGYNDQVEILDTNISLIDCMSQNVEHRKHWGSNVSFTCVRMGEISSVQEPLEEEYEYEQAIQACYVKTGEYTAVC